MLISVNIPQCPQRFTYPSFRRVWKLITKHESTSRSLFETILSSILDWRLNARLDMSYLLSWTIRDSLFSFPKASFNIALAIARTKALYMLAWNGMRSGCSSVPCNAAYTGCIYAWMRVRTYYLPVLLPVILTISCRTFAFAVQCYEG